MITLDSEPVDTDLKLGSPGGIERVPERFSVFRTAVTDPLAG